MNLIKEMDFGTPKIEAETAVTLTIDGRQVNVPAGTSLLRAAAEAGIQIPKLCSTDSLDAFGSCRLCLVEIGGRKGTPSSCTTPAEEGMTVSTQTDRLARIRRGVMELYISDHPLDCLTCAANGDCELQDMAGDVGLREVRYGYDGENHLSAEKDESNPYFTFDPSKCIVCSRCVRACDEIQGTLALTIQARGFSSKVSASIDQDFFSSECVSCGACVQACPTATLMDKSIIEHGQPEHSVITTCAYCGVGCSFKAEMKGGEVVRMMPWKDGGANHGHSCVKGRFAWGYATHKDRIYSPMIRDEVTDPWREVSWDEAITFAAGRFKAIQEKYGRKSIGGISSSRCTNEEVYVVQKLVRAGFGNNNIDTCARVCHSPTGYGLKQTLGTSAGTQNFDSVVKADVMIVIGANPTDAHPVFASRMKKRLREGAKLIVIDPRAIDLVRTPPHIEADYFLPLLPGNNVAVLNALAHVVVTEGLLAEDYIKERCDAKAFAEWKAFIEEDRNSPEEVAKYAGVSAEDLRAAARLYATGGNGAIYYGLGITEHSQGSTAVMAIANLAMATANIGFEGCGVNPLRGQNNVQGSCDMGSFPHELPGYRPVQDDAVRKLFEEDWGCEIDSEPGFRIPNMMDAACEGIFKGIYIQGEDIAQSDPNTTHIEKALSSMECVVVQDLFLNETARFAHVFFPGTSFLEKDGTFINAERRINRVREVIPPKTGMAEWEVTQNLARAMGYDMDFQSSAEIMAEVARLTPTFAGVTFELLDKKSLQWPVNDAAPEGTPTMHIDKFVRGEGNFMLTEFVPTKERVSNKFPMLLTTGRILSQYNVGAQTRRTENSQWMDEDVLDIHPDDAKARGIRDGDWVTIKSRKGETTLKAVISERMQPGVVYTTFHMPESGTNIITTELSDWATSCPEYKVTAVDIRLTNKRSEWQENYPEFSEQRRHIAALEPGE